MKLYQAALKLHSQGPSAYPQAVEAYAALFASEVFAYPEAKSEFVRLDERPELEFSELYLPLDATIGLPGADGLPSSLPQVLFLAHKNHAQFILDCLKARLKTPCEGDTAEIQGQICDYQSRTALADFSRAIVRDESDADLWRRAARIATLAGSNRIARFCLEAAVEVDDDPTVAEVEPVTIDEGLAGEQLKDHLQFLEDQVALSHPIMGPYRSTDLAPALREHIDPYAALPRAPATTTKLQALCELDTAAQARIPLEVTEHSWTSLGEALIPAYLVSTGSSGAAIHICMPPGTNDSMQDVISTDENLGAVNNATIESSAEVTLPAVESELHENVMECSVEIITNTVTVPLQDEDREPALPTRKRSQSEAGIRDVSEDDGASTKRSKRIRNRDSTLDTGDPFAHRAEELVQHEAADAHVFDIVSESLRPLGITELSSLQDLKDVLAETAPHSYDNKLSNSAARDMRDILAYWDEAKASTFANSNPDEILGSSTTGANAGLAAFLEHSKSGPKKLSSKPMFDERHNLDTFVGMINNSQTSLQDAIFAWTTDILETYCNTLWSDELKVSLVRIISFVDGEIFERMKFEFAAALASLATETEASEPSKFTKFKQIQEYVEALFELHLDIYSRITNPNSIVPLDTRIMTKERLDRWASFAASVMTSRTEDPTSNLSLRYLWASVFYATMSDQVSREHKIACWSDLQRILGEAGNAVVELQNNAVMSELSVTAAEREVSSLTTMDFFFNLFNSDVPDPVAIIETLEPVLDPESARVGETDNEDGLTTPIDNKADAPSSWQDMWKFLDAGSTSLRLFLWQRLRESYDTIGYKTKVLSCHLKCIEIIIADLHSEGYAESGDEPRKHKLLMMLKTLDDLVVKALKLALNESGSFEIIDEQHVRTTGVALARLHRLLHTAALFDDEINFGNTQLPTPMTTATRGSFPQFRSKLQEMQNRAWCLLYTLIKEGVAQNPELYPEPKRKLADILAALHYMLGLRKQCKASAKIFLKMMKAELIKFQDDAIWNDYLGQVFHDLYGVNFGVGTFLCEEHGCPTEALDKRTAHSVANYVVKIATSMPMKDLLKSEIKSTIEEMQQATGTTKDSSQMTMNLRNYTEYLKTSIRPLHLYQAMRGQVELNALTIPASESQMARYRWFFLLASMSFAKFRSQKRLSPGGTDDLKVAATFFRLQLQYDSDDWETWYRLAVCYDHELEEEVMWTADKLNKKSPDVVRLQRAAIHCYMLALSSATRVADESLETSNKLADLYYDFGVRLYASSREPFGMEVFYADEYERHFSGMQGLYKKPLHEEMSRAQVWRYAARLFRKTISIRPKKWM